MIEPTMGLREALSIIENQKKIITALEHENNWYQGLIFNPSYNEVDMRLMVATVPREIRMGYTSESPEKKIYAPALAEEVHASPKTVTKRIKRLEDAGIYSYRLSKDDDTGNTRSHLQVLEAAGTPATVEIERAPEGGSTWQDGKRVTRCKDCGSANLMKVSQVICADCGSPQTEKTYKPVNDPNCHCDTDPPDGSDDTPNCHCDTEGETREDPQLPSLTVDTGGVVETSLPPAELRALPIWCPWRYEEPEKPRADGKQDKVPYQTRGRAPQKASVSDEATWTTYDQAQAIYEQSLREGWKRPFDGIGFMCDGSFVGIDLDHCRNKETGEIAAWAQAIIDRFASYWYITPSEEGVRIIIHANKPGPRCKKGDTEIYEEKRFFTWTSMQLPGTPEAIENRQEQLAALYAETFPEQDAPKEVRQKPCAYAPSACSDEQVLSKARGAANGPKFRRLYDECNITGYASQSEAELALCRLLAYYSDGDEDTIDRLMRDWKLFRPEKWDRAARSGETYGQGTIRIALGEQIAS